MLGLLESIIMVVLAVVFPPLPVLIERGCSGTLLINVLLTLLGWLPGVIHSVFVSVIEPRRSGMVGRGGSAITASA